MIKRSEGDPIEVFTDDSTAGVLVVAEYCKIKKIVGVVSIDKDKCK